MNALNRRDTLFVILAGFFVTNAILGEVIGGKLISVGPFTMSIGVLPWPIVFLTTDLMNEYFGRTGVQRLTFLTVALIVYAFAILFVAIAIPASSFSAVSDGAFREVFGQSLWIIIGSIVAFLISQLIDVGVFWAFRQKTGGRHLWLRATGSTAISQLVDTFIIMGIAFWLPGKLTTPQYFEVSSTNYIYKFSIALALTPFVYLCHHAINRYLGSHESDRLIENAAHDSGAR